MAIATQSLGNPNGQGGRKQQKKLQFIQVHCALRTHGCESQRQAAVSPSLDHKRPDALFRRCSAKPDSFRRRTPFSDDLRLQRHRPPTGWCLACCRNVELQTTSLRWHGIFAGRARPMKSVTRIPMRSQSLLAGALSRKAIL